MKGKAFGISCILLIALCCVALWTQSAVSLASAQPEGDLEGKRPIVEYKGKVAASYDNKVFLLKHDLAYSVVHMSKKDWQLGISKGDEVHVKGIMLPDTPLKNELEATDIEMVSRTKIKEDPLVINSIQEILGKRFGAELIGTWGTIEKLHQETMTIKHGTYPITVDLGSFDAKDQFVVGMDVVVIGELKLKPIAREITAVLVRSTWHLRRPGEPEQAQEIKEILKQSPIAQLVKAKGRISLFIGKVDATILYEGEDILVIYRSEKYLSLDAPAGREVEVVGVFGVETHEGREYGVLREARIDRMGYLRQLKRVLK